MSEPTTEDLELVKAAHHLAVTSGMSTERAMAMLTEAMGIRELRAELARLRLRELADPDRYAGWKETVHYGQPDPNSTRINWHAGRRGGRDTVQRRVLLGPREPITTEPTS